MDNNKRNQGTQDNAWKTSKERVTEWADDTRANVDKLDDRLSEGYQQGKHRTEEAVQKTENRVNEEATEIRNRADEKMDQMKNRMNSKK